MALEEKTFVDSITYLPELGATQVRTATVILKDGVEISRTYHRHVVDAVQEDVSKEDERVQAIVNSVASERTQKAEEQRQRDEQDPTREPRS